ncbi:MAG: glycosyltransferase family 4 protein [Bacteroidia bacterium]|nr:glycosyltransferase family 4 protein [Bacteroidia bacterium]MCZ2277455.1 glycosyltransferase family 4 protein [Bacteroidia bacterium]
MQNPTKTLTVVLITNIPNPYRVALFNELNNQLAEKGIRLHVIFGAITYSRRSHQWNKSQLKFNYSVLTSRKVHFGNNEKTYFSYSGLNRDLNKLNPDAVITNGFSISTILLWVKSFVSRIPFIIWTGSVITKGRNDSFLRKLVRSVLLKRSSACVVYGNKAKEYVQSLGADPSKVFIGINTVDTRFFREQTSCYRAEQKPDEIKHLCTVGYFSARKRMLDLLKVTDQLSQKRNDFVLDVIGDGPDLQAMKDYVHEKGFEKNVVFHGFQQQSELPRFFAQSYCFLFQTGFDIWGLVLNEAMAAGLVCLSSINAAATHDLIDHGINGFKVNFENTRETAELLYRLLDDEALKERIGEQAAADIATKVTVRKSAEGFVDAIESLQLK